MHLTLIWHNVFVHYNLKMLNFLSDCVSPFYSLHPRLHRCFEKSFQSLYHVYIFLIVHTASIRFYSIELHQITSLEKIKLIQDGSVDFLFLLFAIQHNPANI